MQCIFDVTFNLFLYNLILISALFVKILVSIIWISEMSLVTGNYFFIYTICSFTLITSYLSRKILTFPSRQCAEWQKCRHTKNPCIYSFFNLLECHLTMVGICITILKKRCWNVSVWNANCCSDIYCL